jgi:hypothetical protein
MIMDRSQWLYSGHAYIDTHQHSLIIVFHLIVLCTLTVGDVFLVERFLWRVSPCHSSLLRKQW